MFSVRLLRDGQHEQQRAEKDQEIARLEAELLQVEADRESARVALTKAREELERERVERAKAESTARTLEAELTKRRDESRALRGVSPPWCQFIFRQEPTPILSLVEKKTAPKIRPGIGRVAR